MKEFLYFLIYSLVGWIYETILCSVRERRFVNRGFLNGPYCPIYGCGALIDIFLLRPFTNPVVIFFSSMVLCSILEYITSYLMEKIFKARWWDYSNMKFNINGRVCLLGALVFGAMSLLLVKFLHPLVVRLVDMIPPLALKIAVPVLAAGFIADFVVTVIGLSGLNARLREFNAMVKAELENTSFAANSREIGKKLKDSLSAQAEKFRLNEKNGPISSAYKAFIRKMSFQQRRTLRNFANFKSMDYGHAVNELRILLAEKFEERKRKNRDKNPADGQ